MNFIRPHIVIYKYPVYILALLLPLLPVNYLAASDSQIVLEVLEARLDKLSDIVVTYEESIERTPLIKEALLALNELNKIKGKKAVMSIDTGLTIHGKEFSYLDGLSLYKKDFINFVPNVELDTLISNDSSVLSNDVSEILAYSDDHVEKLGTIHLKSSRVKHRGTIENQRPLPDSYLEDALAIRRSGNNERLNLEDLEKMDFEFIDKYAKLSSENSGYCREYMFSQELGYAPISYIIRDSIGRIRMQTNMSDFSNVDGLMLPYKIERREYAYNNAGEQKQTRSVNIVVKSYDLDDPNNVPGRYRIQWPENTLISDRRSDTRYRVVGGKLVDINVEKVINKAIKEMPVDLETNTELSLEEKQNIPVITEVSKKMKAGEKDATLNNINTFGQTKNHLVRNLIIVFTSVIIVTTLGIFIINNQRK